MERKILFTDLDGTLLNDKKEVSDKNRSAIKRALDEGHGITITTGRPLASGMMIAEKLELDRPGCYIISYNGGEVYDFGKQEVIRDKRLNMEYAGYLFGEAEKENIHIQTYSDTHIIAKHNTPELQHYHKEGGMPYEIHEDVTKALTKEPHKVLLADLNHPERLQRFMEEHKEWEQGKCLSIFSSAVYLEYCPFGATKGDGVHFLADYLGVPMENTVAAGDERNDISMIQEAGVGVAMKNANPQVLKVADYITEHDNNQDGIAEIIERFMLADYRKI